MKYLPKKKFTESTRLIVRNNPEKVIELQILRSCNRGNN